MLNTRRFLICPHTLCILTLGIIQILQLFCILQPFMGELTHGLTLGQTKNYHFFGRTPLKSKQWRSNLVSFQSKSFLERHCNFQIRLNIWCNCLRVVEKSFNYTSITMLTYNIFHYFDKSRHTIACFAMVWYSKICYSILCNTMTFDWMIQHLTTSFDALLYHDMLFYSICYRLLYCMLEILCNS